MLTTIINHLSLLLLLLLLLLFQLQKPISKDALGCAENLRSQLSTNIALVDCVHTVIDWY